MPKPPLPSFRLLTLVPVMACAVLVAARARENGFTVGISRGSSSPVPPQGPPTNVTPAAVPSGAAASPAAAPGSVDFARDHDAIFDAFYSTGLDATTPYGVSSLAIKKDSMTLLLKHGLLFFMKPIAGEVTGAVFLGDGEASMTPPNPMERFMLKKYSGNEILTEPFTEAVFRFSDGTDKELRAAIHSDPSGAPQAAHAADILKDRNEWLDGTRSFHLEMQFLENRISGLQGQDFFLADFHSVKHDWLTYLFNPQESRENFLASGESVGAKGRR